MRIQREEEKRKSLKVGQTAVEMVAEAPREISMLDDNGIAHIHICGVIGHRLDWFDKFCGNTDVCDVRRELDTAQEQGANAIFLRVDSPGGGITGVQELADYIAELTVPVAAYSDACCASAAYWLASSAGQIWAAPTAEIGSIGIFLPWVDSSAAWQAMGIDFQPFVNDGAIFKSAGHGPSLTPEQRDNTQAFINRIADLFRGHVTGRRPQLMAEAMQGQAFLGCDAPMYGLSDLCGTIEQAYSALCLEAGVFPVDVPLDQYLPISFALGVPIGEAGHDVSDEARDAHGEWTSGGGGSEGANPKEFTGEVKNGVIDLPEPGDEPPTLSTHEQDFVDSAGDVEDDDSVTSAEKAGVITKDEAEKVRELLDATQGFDKDDFDSYTEDHGFSHADRDSLQEKFDAVDRFDPKDASTYSDLHGFPDGAENVEVSPGRTISYNQAEVDEGKLGEATDALHLADDDERPDRVKDVKEAAAKVKANREKAVAANNQLKSDLKEGEKKAVAAQKEMKGQLKAIQGKMDSGWKTLSEKDNGSRD